MTEYTYTELVDTQLANNNIGAISEDDVRSIVDFARVHAMTVVGDYLDTSTAVEVDDTPETDEPTAYDINQWIDAGGDDLTHSYNSGGYVTWAGKGFQYSTSGTNPRLFNLGWNSSLSFDGDAAPESVALVFYHVPDGETFGDNGWTGNRLQVSHYVTVVSADRDSSDTTEMFSGGSALVQMDAGDTVVPVLEHYSSSGWALPRLSFSIDFHSVGVVESTVPAELWTIRSGDVSQAASTAATHNFDDNDVARGTELPEDDV